MQPKIDPVSLLNAWLAVEALQPQTFKTQKNLINDEPPRRKRGAPVKIPPRLVVPFDVEAGRMPWDGSAGDRKQLGLADDVAIRWYLPLAFVRMKAAVDLLVKNVEPVGPEREQASGVAVLALAPFDETGFPATSKILLSSFGWACGEVLSGRIGELHRFIDVQEEIARDIGEALVERAADGSHIPTTKRGFSASMTALMVRLKLPKEVLERPRFAIRVIGDSDKDPVDIINSFFLRDLHRLRNHLRSGGHNPVLSAYLAQNRPIKRRNVLSDKALLEDLVAPAHLPLARWPAPKPAKLVTLQQAAVNAALRDLAQGGLLSINGPPGTGKTTLLRDVLAAVILRRAEALVEFENPDSAFIEVDLVAEGGKRQILYKLDSSLRRHGVVVASSNNAAVRNVSAELPLAGTVAPESVIRYFSGTADVVQGKENSCWGLIAAVLGNRTNRANFVEDAWWHPDWGLEKYLGAVTGRTKRRSEVPPARIIEAEQAPQSRGAALERWRQARLDFREKRSAADRMRALREQIRQALSTGATAQQASEDALAVHMDALASADAATVTRQAAMAALAQAEIGLADARRLLDGNAAMQPGTIARLLGRDERWRQVQQQALDLMSRALADQDAARTEFATASDRMTKAAACAGAAAADLAQAQEALTLLRDLEAHCPDICRGSQAGPAFWESAVEAIHTASPWADPDFTAMRDALFVAALALHRAFIDAAAWSLKSNLGLMMDHLKGKRIPSGADVHLGDLWDSFFLVIPLVSTTFASFDRLMEGMGTESIGWLIVDEAGQATPQAAAGALWRSHRALIIGDPLQIPPVSKVPTGLIRSIFAHYDVHPDLWAAPRASAQTLADAASPLMAKLGAGADMREIGLPLLVHRRCQNPMFAISNEIAYGGLMVHAVGAQKSPIAEALSPWLTGSCWLNVAAHSDQLSRIEGDAVLDVLRRLGERGIREPSLYIISPFREVADRLRAFVVKSGVLDGLGIPPKRQKDWGDRNIGTVHTFQGKEAEAVLVVLGASTVARQGARNWAGGSPNILNVAATRAKQILYVIGRHDAWANAGVFATASAMLAKVDWPFEPAEKSIQTEGELELWEDSEEDDETEVSELEE